MDVVKQETARLNTDILELNELKWMGMGEFNSHDHYIAYCGQQSFRRKSSPHSQCTVCLVAQSCLNFCDPMDCSLPGSSVHGDSPGKNTGVGCHDLLQRIFPTQGSNPDLPHCRRILYQLSYHGSPIRESKMQYLGAISKTTE